MLGREGEGLLPSCRFPEVGRLCEGCRGEGRWVSRSRGSVFAVTLMGPAPSFLEPPYTPHPRAQWVSPQTFSPLLPGVFCIPLAGTPCHLRDVPVLREPEPARGTRGPGWAEGPTAWGPPGPQNISSKALSKMPHPHIPPLC